MVARTTWPAPLCAVALDSILTPMVLVFLVLFSKTDLANGNYESLNAPLAACSFLQNFSTLWFETPSWRSLKAPAAGDKLAK